MRWDKGGNDYGACIGSGFGWLDSVAGGATAHRGTLTLTAAQLSFENPIQPLIPGFTSLPHTFDLGMFYINSNTNFAAVKDGTSNVIMFGELQRLNHSTDQFRQSSDGWAWGGAATLFSTREGINKDNFYGNPGSEHPTIANFCFADGSARPLNESIDLITFQNLGNMQNGIPVSEF